MAAIGMIMVCIIIAGRTIAAVTTYNCTVSNNTILNRGRGIIIATYCSPKYTHTFDTIPIATVRIAIGTINATEAKSGNGKTIDNCIGAYIIKLKRSIISSIWASGLTLDNRSCHNIRIIRISAGYGNCFVYDLETPNCQIWLVAGGDYNYIAIIGVIDGVLQVCIVTRDIKDSWFIFREYKL